MRKILEIAALFFLFIILTDQIEGKSDKGQRTHTILSELKK